MSRRRGSSNAPPRASDVDDRVEHSSLDLRLKRVDRVYRPGELVQGVVVVNAKNGWSHQGISLKVEGSAKLQLSARSVGLFESFYSSIKPLELVSEDIEIAAAGRVPDGVTEMPFEFRLEGIGRKDLHESYHGVYVNVCYTVACDCQRGVMSRDLHRDIEFIVEVPSRAEGAAQELPFTITPESLENVRASAMSSIPKFHISGKLHRVHCPINLPFTGEIVIEDSETAVRSVELQLVRVETVSHEGGSAREATEIQNIQLAEGDVCRNLMIPMYMIFPRLFTCPTMLTNGFKVEFEVNVIVLFADGYMITENFPITLYRDR